MIEYLIYVCILNMAEKIIDIYNRFLRYDDKTVYIAFGDKTSEPYFNAKQVCKLLRYEKAKEALQKNVSSGDIFFLKDIVKNYKQLYYKVQGHTKFLNEAGLYSIILRGKKKISQEIFNWITNEVLPSIRKHGEYRLDSEYKKQIEYLEEQLKEKQKEIDVMKSNLKNKKYEEGEAVYIMRIINDDVNLDVDEIIDIKFGRTKDMNKRKKTYDTCTKNKVQILKIIYVNDSKTIEKCVMKKMEDMKVKDKKEYFECSYNQIIDELAKCIMFYENKEINKTPDIFDISRVQKIENFDKDKKYIVKFLTDEEFENLFKCDKFDTTDDDSDSESDTDSLSEIIIDSYLNNEQKEQSGGSKDNNYELKYKICCLKLLRMKYDRI